MNCVSLNFVFNGDEIELNLNLLALSAVTEQSHSSGMKGKEHMVHKITNNTSNVSGILAPIRLALCEFYDVHGLVQHYVWTAMHVITLIRCFELKLAVQMWQSFSQ